MAAPNIRQVRTIMRSCLVDWVVADIRAGKTVQLVKVDLEAHARIYAAFPAGTITRQVRFRDGISRITLSQRVK